MNNKTIIITYHKDAYFFPYIKDKNIKVFEPIRNKSLLTRIMFRIPFLCLFTYGFRNELKTAKKVIIFDSAYNELLGKYLKFKMKDKVFLYFWNPISKTYSGKANKIISNAKKIMPVYSFDHNDCENFKISYRPMVYSSDVNDCIDIIKETKYDLFFLGWKKDRSNQIEKLYNEYFKGKIKCLFILVGDEERVIDDSIIYTRNRIPYSKYLDYFLNSRCILDIPQEGQEGLTIRNVECLFFRKKMITTNACIVHYDYYNENNTLILDNNHKKDLNCFINSDYIDIDENIKRKYDFKYWIESFG